MQNNQRERFDTDNFVISEASLDLPVKLRSSREVRSSTARCGQAGCRAA